MHTLATVCEACGHAPMPIDAQDAHVELFRLVGEYWAIRFEGLTCNVHDGKGLRYIAQLLSTPGREVHVLELLTSPDHDCRSGRDADAYTVVERARVSVTRAIHRALGRIGTCHPALGRHLDTTIRTGTYCLYLPDSRVPIAWQTA